MRQDTNLLGAFDDDVAFTEQEHEYAVALAAAFDKYHKIINDVLLFRRAGKLSQKALASKLETEQSRISELERGKRTNVPLIDFLMIGEFLGFTVELRPIEGRRNGEDQKPVRHRHGSPKLKAVPHHGASGFAAESSHGFLSHGKDYCSLDDQLFGESTGLGEIGSNCLRLPHRVSEPSPGIAYVRHIQVNEDGVQGPGP